MSLRKPLFLTAAALALALVPMSQAIAGPHEKPCDHGRRIDRLESHVKALDLDPTTLASAQRILEDARLRRREIGEDVRSAQRQLRDLLEMDQPDLVTVLAQADQVGTLETEAHKVNLRAIFSLRAVLTTEQWEQLRQHRKQRRESKERSDRF